MIKKIKWLINLIKSERNWHFRTCDAPKVFKKIQMYVETKETWDAKMSEQLRIRITKDADSEEE